MRFMDKWYRRCARGGDLANVVRDWNATGGDKPTLIFTIPPELAVPTRWVAVADVCDHKSVRLWFLTCVDSWSDTVKCADLGDVVLEFLGLDSDQEVYVELSPAEPWLE